MRSSLTTKRFRGRALFHPGLFIQSFLLLLVPCGIAQGQGHGGPTSVEVLPVIEREIAPTIWLVGTVQGQLHTTIASEIAGRVAEFPIDDGQVVAAGDVLCRLRDTPQRLALQEAKARVSQLAAAVAVQEADLRKAEFEHQRVLRLHKLERSTDKELTDAKADFEMARSRVALTKSELEAGKAVADRLADALDQTVIRSPVAGAITARHTQVGEWVTQGGAVADLIDLSIVRVRINVPEACIQFCRVGDEVMVRVAALNRDFPGRIGRIIPSADERARTFPVDVDIANSDGALKAGMFASAAAPSAARGKRLLVPKDAVMMRQGMAMVYAVQRAKDGAMASVVPVEIIAEVLDYVAVAGPGLTPGVEVVVRGNEFMRGPGPVLPVPHPTGETQDNTNVNIPAGGPVDRAKEENGE